jgi:hypothetical protein
MKGMVHNIGRKLWKEMNEFRKRNVLENILFNINLSCKSVDDHK